MCIYMVRMLVCVHVCIHMYVYMYAYPYIHKYESRTVLTGFDWLMYVCVHVCMYTDHVCMYKIHTYIHMSPEAKTGTFNRMMADVCMYACIYVYM